MKKAITLKDEEGNNIYPCPYYPIGAIYESANNSNPSALFGGTWILIFNDYYRQQVGTQIIYSNISGSGNVSKTNLIGAYNYELIDGLFNNVAIPTGWHKEYRVMVQGRTGGDNKITVFLNNISTNSIGTWSSDTFRVIGASCFFKETDIVLETTMGYKTNGINLKYQITGVSNSWNIYNIAVQGFIVSDNKFYKWKRIS